MPFSDHTTRAHALDGALDQSRTPLVSALREYLRRDMTGFHVPGHGSGHVAPDDMIELIGSQAFAADLPALPETDNANNPTGPILEAEQLAADLWGADRTMFLVNGSTIGNQLALMSVCRPGAPVIVPRNAHRSILSGIIMSGALPVFVQPVWDAQRGIAHNVTPQAVAEALQQHPDATAVSLVSPTYHGMTADIARIAELCHKRDVPLLVDEAWGAHLEFDDQLPATAVRSGADVVIQSTHKLLTSLTQSSMVHIVGDRARVRRDVLALMQSTSASYLLLSSLDAARRQLAQDGRSMVRGALVLARELRDRLNEIPGIAVFGRELVGQAGVHDFDETRITICADGADMTGIELARVLNERFGIQVELAGLREVLLNVSVGTTRDDIECTVEAVAAIARGRTGHGHLPVEDIPEPIASSETVLLPRDAFFTQSRPVALEESIGCISVEMVTPYPPGIPTLVPGERITQDAVAYLTRMRALNATFTGTEDTTLETINVVAEADTHDVSEPRNS